jgi:predicted GH43/DUF377 family glycosyl hydrolase
MGIEAGYHERRREVLLEQLNSESARRMSVQAHRDELLLLLRLAMDDYHTHGRLSEFVIDKILKEITPNENHPSV